jgi:acid phosphatase (class A)
MRCVRLLAGIVLVSGVAAVAQGGAVAPKAPKAAKVPYYVDPTLVDAAGLILPPPAQDSSVTRAELAEIHRIEAARTPEQVKAAEYDDLHEDMFLYGTVLGPEFTAANLPLLAALSAHVRNDVSVVGSPLKGVWGRPRPYNYDATLHPICTTNQEASYPSGHSLNGFTFGYILAQMIPEKRAEILARADDYAHNRMVCEAHYASDIEASRAISRFLVGEMFASPRFEREMTAAKAEVRSKLRLP